MNFQGLASSVVATISWYLSAIALATMGLAVIFIERYAAFRAFKARHVQAAGWGRVRILGGALLVLGFVCLTIATVKYSHAGTPSAQDLR